MILLDPLARPVIAHRGASGDYPENTLLAFAQAVEQGADACELDVRVTADGIPVVLHDATLDRTTDSSGPVCERTFDQLQAVNAGRGEHVPSMAQVLERFSGVPLLLEMKDARAARPLLDVLRRHGAQERVLVGAFRRRLLGPLARSEFRRVSVRGEVAAFWMGARLGLGLRLGSFGAFSMPETWGRIGLVDAAFIRCARRAGLPAHVWTVDDPARARRLRQLGVCGIITNYPERMRHL